MILYLHVLDIGTKPIDKGFLISGTGFGEQNPTLCNEKK